MYLFRMFADLMKMIKNNKGFCKIWWNVMIPQPIRVKIFEQIALRKKCPYSGLFWSVFSHIQTKYGEVRNIPLYSVRMRENTNQNNSEYGLFTQCRYASVIQN